MNDSNHSHQFLVRFIFILGINCSSNHLTKTLIIFSLSFISQYRNALDVSGALVGSFVGTLVGGFVGSFAGALVGRFVRAVLGTFV